MRNIVVWGRSNYPWLREPFLNRLKAGENAKVHFICAGPEDIIYWKKEDKGKTIDTFVTTNRFFAEYDRCFEPPEEIFGKARRYEEKYGMLVADLLQTDRHLGRGFASGGIGHPKSELSDKASYEKSVTIYNKIIDFWEDYFDRTDPDLIIGVIAGVIGKGCAAVARHRGIPMRTLASAKYKSYYYWIDSEYYTCPDIRRNFESLRSKVVLSGEIEDTGEMWLPEIIAIHKRFARFSSKRELVKRILAQLKRHIYRRYKRIVSMGNYKLSEQVRYLFRIYRDIKLLDKLKTIDMRKLSGWKYVFVALNTEPEVATGVYSPEFNEQLAMIELLAKNLPAGVRLAVKEHPVAIGRRPRDFYSTIEEIPNAVIVSPKEDALCVIKNALCVAVITSTCGTEAAIMGVPVISFGVHNNFNFLPHAHVVESWKELRPLLSRLCAVDTDEARDKRRKDGLKYLEALKASSIILDTTDNGKNMRFTPDNVELIYSSLKNTVKSGAADELKNSYSLY